MDIQHKVLPLTIKAVKQDGDGGPHEIEGYASVFHNLDDQGDIVEPGAFKDTLNNDRASIKALLGHEWGGLPVGLPSHMEEDAHGLFTRTKMFDTQPARDTVAVAKGLLENGEADNQLGMSIGYLPLEVRWEDPDDDSKGGDFFEIRHLEVIKLFEYSFVTLAANTLAAVTGAKGGGKAHELFAHHKAEGGADIERVNIHLVCMGTASKGLGYHERKRLEQHLRAHRQEARLDAWPSTDELAKAFATKPQQPTGDGEIANRLAIIETYERGAYARQ